MDFSTDTRIASILVKQITGEITEDERLTLEKWLEASPRNRKLYHRLTGGESLRWHEENFCHIDNAHTFARIKRRIGRRRAVRRLITVGAAAVLAAGVFAATLLPRSEPEPTTVGHNAPRVILSVDNEQHCMFDDLAEESAWEKLLPPPTDSIAEPGETAPGVNCRIEMPRGIQRRLRLDDGTMVWLNSESTLEYPARFTETVREVSVSGEAFFEVAHEDGRPFVVNMDRGVSVSVLGTRFDVESYSESERMLVTLVDGAVTVNSGEKTMQLEPHQQAVIDRRTLSMSLHAPDNIRPYISWIEGRLFIENAPLDEIFAKMERWYDITLVYDRTADLSALGTFTVKASNREKFTSVLNALGEVMGLEYTVDERLVFIGLPI